MRTQAEQGLWDLSDLYRDFADPAIAADRRQAKELVSDFVRRFRGRVAQLAPSELRGALDELARITHLASRPEHYASLRFAVATDGTDERAAHGAAQTFSAQLQQQLVFFAVELKALDEASFAALIKAPELQDFEHYLRYQRQFSAHTLSEPEEQAILRKDLTGKTAWVNLYTQVTSGLLFKLVEAGEEKQLTRGELAAYASHPDRSLRIAARRSAFAGFAPHHEVLSFVFNTLFEDHRCDMQARGYGDVLDYTVLKDDLDAGVVATLLEVASANFDLVQRYQKLRARLLSVDDYGIHDLRAPLFGEEPSFSWAEACDLVVAAFSAFDERAGAVARRFIERHWLHAFPAPGKTSGAFCSPGYPPDHPWVMLNFAGRLEDVVTLAHELGHALHFYLSLSQSPLNYWTGLPMAETASVFAELWLHEHLMASCGEGRLRAQLLDRQVQSAVMTGFQQVSYVNWELRAHRARAEGVLSVDRLGELWGEEQERLWGAEVLRSEFERHRWMQIPHFVFARFYCYSYAFGKFLTLGLHARWREQGQAFVGAYLDLLERGGSRSPAELLRPLGLKLQDPGFWQQACDVVRGQLAELEDAVALED